MDPTATIDRFMRYLEVERNFSAESVRAYRADLAQFSAHLAMRDCADLAAVDALCLRGWLASLDEGAYERRSIARKLASVRSLFRWLQRTGVLRDNPAGVLRTPRVGKRLPSFLDEPQIRLLLEAPPAQGFEGLRDRALLELLYATGVRVSELVRLDLADLEFERGVLRARGKGRKVRMLPLLPSASAALHGWLAARQAPPRRAQGLAEGTLAVFLNQRGTRLTDRSVRRIVNKWVEQAALSAHVTPHTLRHTFATHLLNHGADLRDVQELLGHANLATTQVYTHVTTTRMLETYEQSHPLAK